MSLANTSNKISSRDTYPAPRGPLPFRALAANRTKNDIKLGLQLMLVFIHSSMFNMMVASLINHTSLKRL